MAPPAAGDYWKVPVKRACAPPERVTVPLKACPATALTGSFVVSGKSKFRVAVGDPAAPRTQLPERVRSAVAPAQVRLTPVTFAPVAAEFDSVM